MADFKEEEGEKPIGQFFSYEKGYGNQADEFELGKLSHEEMEKWRKEREMNMPKTIENNRTWTEDKKAKKDKCDFCNKKNNSEKGGTIWSGYWGGNSFSFCSSECMNSHNANYLSLENINKTNLEDFLSGNPKCLVCGITKDKVNSWNQTRFDEWEIQNYCDDCFEKRHKDSEIQSEQTKLDNLKNQLQNPANSGKKEDLKNQIKETENNLNRLK
ncbi:MAG: hypothetical protein GBAus27B_000096 [Mycoplasmataceae bacterium]|nr:MAG: hypothetical protein GBAus27B_000096 [Mycoplasmataceae bacterium]